MIYYVQLIIMSYDSGDLNILPYYIYHDAPERRYRPNAHQVQ